MGGRGRGRGRGSTSSFSREQLSSMGVSANEALPTVVTQPPPLYPPLERKPVNLTSTLETNYMLILKQDFLENMRYASTCTDLPTENREPEQEIDKLLAQLPKLQQNCKFDWNLLPKELRSKVKAKRNNEQNKDVNIQDCLEKLEKIEGQKGNEKVIKKEREEEIEEEPEIMDEQDIEMDDGTDYANNYFDNGEDYDEQDDNLDDGPVY